MSKSPGDAGSGLYLDVDINGGPGAWNKKGIMGIPLVWLSDSEYERSVSPPLRPLEQLSREMPRRFLLMEALADGERRTFLKIGGYRMDNDAHKAILGITDGIIATRYTTRAEVLEHGGGFVRDDPVAKRVVFWGESMSFGPADRDVVLRLAKEGLKGTMYEQYSITVE